MSEEKNSSNTSKYGIQEYLSLGYIYLIFLGIAGDVIYYKFLEINILDYSTISDVLMAPITLLVRDIRVLFIVVIAMMLVCLLYFKGFPALHYKFKHKAWYRKVVKDIDKADEKFSEMKANNVIQVISFFLLSMFVGINVGSGIKIKKSIENGEVKVSHSILFNDNTTKRVKIIGQNSTYLFYLLEKQKDISIMPIGGNIKEIKAIKEVVLVK